MNASLSDLSRASEHAPKGAVRGEIPQPAFRWRTRILLPGVLFAIVIALLLMTSASVLLPATEVAVAPVVVKSVQGAAGSVTVQAPGWIEPDPHPYFISALAEGIVEEVLVLEGAEVEAGAVVARLVDDDAQLALRRAEAELAQRGAERAAAEADLEAAELQFEHLVERSRDVAMAEARVAEFEAEARNAQARTQVERARLAEITDEYDRKSQLIDSEAVSEAIVVRLRLQLEAQQATLESAEAQTDVLDAKLDQAIAERAAARTNRELLIEERRAVALNEAAVNSAEAAVALAEAARDEAALRLERMEVRSSVAGVVMRRLATPGSMLAAASGMEHSMHVVHVYDPQRLQVRVDVPLADASNVSVGQHAEIAVEVLPDRVFTGRITRVVHEADIQKNTVEVKVAIDEPSSDLKPEMLARVRFLGRAEGGSGVALRQRIFAPEALIRRGEGGDASALIVADRVDQRGIVERRSITTGRGRIDDWIEIDSGLHPGDLLIAEPATGLEPGDRVRITSTAPETMGGRAHGAH